MTLFEILIAGLLVSACLAPLLGNIARQTTQSRWARDRIIAEQLASEVLEHLMQQGYSWMWNLAWVGTGAPNGLRSTGNAKVMDTVVGSSNYVNTTYSTWADHASPNAINPALSGPDAEADPNGVNTLSWGLSLDAAAQTNARDTFSNAYGFNRRVEIWGGASYNPPGLAGINNIECFMVKVTVWTPAGTMQAPMSPTDPDGRHQVVTFIGRR